MIAYARLQGDLDPEKTKYGWYKGMVSAVMPDKARSEDLFIMEGFSCTRLLAEGRRHRLPQGAARGRFLSRAALRSLGRDHGPSGRIR